MTMLGRNFTSSKLKRIGVSRFDESINLNLARFVRALIEYSASNSNQLRSFETGQFLIEQTQTLTCTSVLPLTTKYILHYLLSTLFFILLSSSPHFMKK
ncbi:conserved hypothetical protein, partial [Trichinella spiralis]|uniref:hypothetical protein n=1 Tax=Trichinella spiralis TaxID=6334 RepID=UPI0001EFBE13